MEVACSENSANLMATSFGTKVPKNYVFSMLRKVSTLVIIVTSIIITEKLIATNFGTKVMELFLTEC